VSGDGTGDLAGQTIDGFLQQLAARVPAPGGGATAALHAAQAAALLAMVGRYTTGERYAEHADTVQGVVAAADAEREAGLQLAAADAAAFVAVTEAYKLPRTTPEEQEHRRTAIADALAGAAVPPADVIRASATLLSLAEALLPIANRNVITDVAAATEAARAAATTARLNVEINLGGIADDKVRDDLRAVLEQVEGIVRRAEAVEHSVRGLLQG
jgi:formiminotetrahydrofolate cyclodeaminase